MGVRALAAMAVLGVLLAARPAPAQQGLTLVEQVAFDVRTVQSYLMVAALSCDRHEDYNRFVTRHRTDLSSAWNTIEAWFRRTHGRDAQRHMDEYITNLANLHAQDGIRRAGQFCTGVAALWQDALTQSGPIAIAALTGRYTLASPLDEVLSALAARQPAPRQGTPAARTAQR